MKYNTLVLSALVALGGAQAWAQTARISSVAITTGVVTVTERIGTPGNIGFVGDNLAGLTYVAGNIGMSGDAPVGSPTSIALFTLTGRTIPGGGPQTTDFMGYGTLISPTQVAKYSDVAAQLTADSYSGLAFAIDNLSLPIAGCFYTIHHKPLADYFAVIVPATGNLSTAYDLKPMSWQAPGGTAGGPTSPGTTGYFALAYTPIIGGGAVTGYAAGSMFYLRTDGSSHTQFGEMIPALESASTDKLDLTTAVGSFGVGGYTTLAYSPTNVGYGVNQFYYLRQDSTGTGNTILGRLNPSLVAGTRTISDIANLGGVFNTLTFVVDATGPASAWGTNNFYLTGAPLASGAQSISFAAIPDHNTGDIFTITPTASSGQDLAVTVVSGSAQVLTTGIDNMNPSQRVFTVTVLGPGTVTLQAKQAGGGGFTANWLQQSFTATGATLLAITGQPTNQTAATGTTASFSVTAPLAVSYQWRKAGANIAGNASATTATLTLTNVQSADAASYDVVVTNASGSIVSNAVTLTVTTAAPVITNSPLTAAGTVGTPFSFTITATNSPTSYAASTLPLNGLAIVAATGVISGTPTAAGIMSVVLGATNAGGTGHATLTITITPATTIDSAAASVSATAQSYTVAVTSNTSWTASSDSAWATVSPASGTGNGTVTVTVTANTSTSSRTATITIGGQTQTLTQAGVVASTTIGSATASISATAPSYTVAVTSNTSWTATSDSAWATVSPASGTGNGTVTVTVTANTSASSRTATITIGGQTQVLTQAGFPQIVTMTYPTVPVTFSTLAGTPLETGTLDGTGSAARFNFPCGTTADGKGNLYVVDTDNGTIRRIAVSTGVVSTLAGTAGSVGNTDGTGGAALFNKPTGVAFDGGGNIYVADTLNNRLRKVSDAGVVTTLAGSGAAGSADGTGGAAEFSGPQGLVYSGGYLYVADTNNHTIRKVLASNGTVTTLAGLAGAAGSSDGSGSLARFNYPAGMAVDSLGNLFVADTDNHTIREIQSSGLVSTLAGLAGVSGAADGTGNAVRFNSPSDVAVDASNNVYVADTDNDTIRMLVPSTGAVTTLAGLAGVFGHTDGSGSAVRFFEPAGLAVDTDGSIYVADTDNDTIRMAQLPQFPFIQKQPQSQTAVVGSGVTFAVTATGRPAVTYQWQFNGTPISGATSASYSIVSAQSGNAGTYTVVVANTMGSVTSNPATLTVNVASASSAPPAGGGGGGGGAMASWFVALLALLGVARLWPKVPTWTRSACRD
jgi:hypothetical protein